MGAGKVGAILLGALSLCAGLLFLTGGFATSRAQSEPAVPTADINDEIVFIDANGFIRVFDYVDDVPAETVRWYSPIGGFADIALGDVNDDSDMEIIGVRGGPEEGELVIFDPVVVDRTRAHRWHDQRHSMGHALHAADSRRSYPGRCR